jgi:ketosteroid isomerase-like protein
VTDTPTADPTEIRIRSLIHGWERAIQSGDIDAILARHSDDVVMYDVPGPLQSTGLAGYRKTWELFFRYGRPDPGVFAIEDLVVIAGDEVAFAFGLLRIGGSDSPVCRLTLGLQKRAGQWLIRHEHHSAPHQLAEPGEPT